MDTAIVYILLALCFNFFCQVCSYSLKKEAYMTVPQLISAAGYPVEEHNITTADGYTLVMHRIPGGRHAKSHSAKRTGKKVVFLAHGITGSSGDFVIMGPKRSLGYILADAGYDVWLGNFRGTVYSLHAWLTKKDPAFWEFSFHEHGKFDAPAMIDKVLQVTGLPKLLYVGYFMGTTSFFIMLAQWPEYNKKVIACVALAPAVYFDNFKLEANVLMGMLNIPGLMRLHGRVSASLDPKLLEYLASHVCTGYSITSLLCLKFIYSMAGISVQADYDMLSVITARVQPASWRQIEHYGKIIIQ